MRCNDVSGASPAGALHQQPPSYFDHQRSSAAEPPVDFAPDYVVSQGASAAAAAGYQQGGGGGGLYQGYSQPV